VARLKDDYRQLTGPQKAAIFLLSLSEQHAGKLFEAMEEQEIRELSQSMAGLGTVSAGVVERLFVEFADQLSGSGSLVGSMESTERLLGRFLGRDRVDQIMEEIRGPAGRTMWDKLGNVSEAVLANFLKNEYPQTVAVVLSKVRPDHAARVLGLLPENFAIEVIMRMLRMEVVQKDILDHVENTLRSEFMTNLARSARRDVHELMADIFNSFDRNTETRFMAALEERNYDSAERIRQLMFTFEDLERLNDAALQMLLRNLEKEKLALALKGGTEDIRQRFLSNMSERAAKLLREDMDALGPVRLRDVDEAQAAIVAAAKALADAGEIDISVGERDELVY
jgi:flagellar motor switch protein FliG